MPLKLKPEPTQVPSGLRYSAFNERNAVPRGDAVKRVGVAAPAGETATPNAASIQSLNTGDMAFTGQSSPVPEYQGT